MISELRKSISAILYERAISPLYGTFILSWLIWNWRIWYLTFFVDERILGQNKVKYIEREYLTWDFLAFYPIASTAVLLILVPFLANAAYRLGLKFQKTRTNDKNYFEDRQLLTSEQSRELKRELRSKDAEFENYETKSKLQIKELEEEIKALYIEMDNKKEIKEVNEEDNVIKNTPSRTPTFEDLWHSGKLNDFIDRGKDLLMNNEIKKDRIPNVHIAIALGFLELYEHSNQYVVLTQKGKEFLEWAILKS
ncbi:hypothetical protein [Arcticibacterium luteifluviistationis]|uniref:Uncharacterized protein n=1 Tax=Arcticibacterium luteifluviistationis TaxID=1784714 RepID=A0A2Z4G870_9BACT|nr:hypothetical protein [Arcticibacterium luteifluviistationis]AWV97253.1 hypothetical protein DJ013_03335 [Arcticibacterium luteifluviistationis]